MAGNLTSLLSLGTKLILSITASAQAAASSSKSNNSKKRRACTVDEDLERLMRTFNWIKDLLYDAEEREIRDRSIKLWLEDLKKVTYDAEDTLNKHRCEVTHNQVKARKASEASGSHKKKQMEYIVPNPDGIIDRLNKIRNQFDEIEKEREALQLRESDGVDHLNNKILQPQVHQWVDEATIFGRDTEVKEIIDFLLFQKEKSFSVISIVGKGGLGKTTIAQLVYKDQRVSMCFDLCGWVCASEEFDVNRLIKATIESISESNNGVSELSRLQEEFAKVVNGKKILLVLDDVWNENQSFWELFRVSFKEAKMVRILVTTRNKKVADVMQTKAYCRLTDLSEDSCWQLFQHYAFIGTSRIVPTHLEVMGREITRKCGGLPSIVKSIASLLRHETHEESWRDILESDIWGSKSLTEPRSMEPSSRSQQISTVSGKKAGYLIISLLSLGTELLSSIRASGQAPSAEEDLEMLMQTLRLIKATLYDAEERENIDHYVKHWLKELKEVAYDAEDVLSEYRYEVTRLQVEARKASQQMKSVLPIPDGLVYRLHKIRSQFDEIEKDRKVLKLRECDGVRRPRKKTFRETNHMVDEAIIFGRDAEITEVINFLLSEKEKEKSFSVISIVGKGGLGKTTIAQLVYKDETVSWQFDLIGWVCVSENFDVRRLIKQTIESISNKMNTGVNELSQLQEKLAKTVKGKKILLVLDDVWNEDQKHWELFRVHLEEAKMVRILVTTRNRKVAEIMQTTDYCRPNKLSEDSCWQLFQHYAFIGATHIVPTHLKDIGRKIMRKCDGLPLAVKLIASLLSHETDKEGWLEVLECDLWELNPSNDIFPALEISYTHLPAHLKPCFLFCSMYPKDYLLEKMNLIELWISHGYIESMDRRRIKEVGIDYYEELKDRSFLDDFSGRSSECCKLHDIIHDLARLNSENEHYSVEANQPLNTQQRDVPRASYHLYARGFVGYVNELLYQNMKGLRTLSMDVSGCSRDLEHQYCIDNTKAVDQNSKLSEYYKECSGDLSICNLTKFEALRILELKGGIKKIPDFIPELKHLVYLGISSFDLKMLPLSIGLLFNLQTLILDCFSLEYLPESIGDLAKLQFLNIQSSKAKKLPKSLCLLGNLLRLVIRTDQLEELPLDLRNLTNLHELTILSNRIQALPNTIGQLSSLEELKLLPLRGSVKNNYKLNYDPQGYVNFPAIKTMAAWLRVRSIAWLKDMNDLEGKLSIEGLEKMRLADAQRANLKNKCNLETLDLCWDSRNYKFPYDAKSELILSVRKSYDGRSVGLDDVDFSLLECLQPHPNLKKLLLRWYPSARIPEWMRDPSSFHSIQEVLLESCEDIQDLPFGNFHTLKHLKVQKCSSIEVVNLNQMSFRLEKLQFLQCDYLELITGLGDLNMLAALKIYSCKSLKLLMMDGLQLVEPAEPFVDSSHEMSHIDRQSIFSLKRLEIEDCDLLYELPDGLIPSGCDVCVRGCGCPDIDTNEV
ncbi:putative disease resistance RPP13-like protein 1 [Carex rostrata]